jgi:excisionase family DNA binding protein
MLEASLSTEVYPETFDLMAVAGEDAYSILDDLETRKGVLKVKEVAELLRVSQDSIYDLVDNRRIPAFYVGSQIRFDPKTIAFWLRKKDPTFVKAATT